MNGNFKLFIAFVKNVFGIWHGAKRYPQLYETIREIRAKNILEIGTWNGARAELMILAAQEHHPKDQVAYYGFDLFETMPTEDRKDELSKKPPTEAAVKEKLLKTGSRVILFKGDTNTVLKEALNTLPKMDFIYIDGGHSIATIQNDWDNAQRLMHDGTIVIFDDYWPNKTDGGAKPIVDAIDRSVYDVRLLPVFDAFYKTVNGPLIIKFAEVRKHRP